MKYTLESITEHAADAAAFVAECERQYEDKVLNCANALLKNAAAAPIVLLAGPSGSGKTTTATKIRQVIQDRGHNCQVISMDDYFLTVNPATHPRDSRGNIDFESPYCLDIKLFLEHIGRLSEGKPVSVPHFDFANQRRHPDMHTELKPVKGGICIFEGIHALNPMFSEGMSTQKVYVSARSNIKDDSRVVFKGTWVRLMRRMIRDNNFRAWEPKRTLSVWGMVRRGEKSYISPYKDLAAHQIDTHMPYEVCMLRNAALPMLADIKPGCDREAELRTIAPALERFPSIGLELLPEGSLLREFLG